MEPMKKQIANSVTLCRILGSIGLLFCPVYSACFYRLYIFCGLTDMVDGTIARKMGAVSTFGARLDTAADLSFAAVAFLKILPLIQIREWLWFWIAAIAAVKIFNLVWGLLHRKHIPSIHTAANKTTGFCLFLLPLTLAFAPLEYTAPVVCTIATFAAIQEGYYIVTGRNIVSFRFCGIAALPGRIFAIRPRSAGSERSSS